MGKALQRKHQSERVQAASEVGGWREWGCARCWGLSLQRGLGSTWHPPIQVSAEHGTLEPLDHTRQPRPRGSGQLVEAVLPALLGTSSGPPSWECDFIPESQSRGKMDMVGSALQGTHEKIPSPSPAPRQAWQKSLG